MKLDNVFKKTRLSSARKAYISLGGTRRVVPEGLLRKCNKCGGAIIAEDVTVGSGSHLGVGEYAPSQYDPKVYQFDLVTVGEHSVIPAGVRIGKNTAISGVTEPEDYKDGMLASGDYIIKAGGVQ